MRSRPALAAHRSAIVVVFGAVVGAVVGVREFLLPSSSLLQPRLRAVKAPTTPLEPSFHWGADAPALASVSKKPRHRLLPAPKRRAKSKRYLGIADALKGEYAALQEELAKREKRYRGKGREADPEALGRAFASFDLEEKMQLVFDLDADAATMERWGSCFHGDAGCTVQRIGRAAYAALNPPQTRDDLGNFGVMAMLSHEPDLWWELAPERHSNVRRFLECFGREKPGQFTAMFGLADPLAIRTLATVFFDGNMRLTVADTKEHFYFVRFVTS